MSAHGTSKHDGDPREQWERVRLFLRRSTRFWPTFLTVIVVGIVGCALFLILRKPTYRSETLILYTEGIRPIDATADPTRIGPRDAAVRLREMLMARPRLQAAIREFGLYPDVLASYGPMDAVEEFREDIDFRAPGGDTFSIGYRGRSPEEAQAVTRHLAESLIAEESSLRLQQAKAHRAFLLDERKRTEAELGKAERAVAQFLAEHPELAADVMLLMPGGGSTGAAIRAASAEAAAPAPASPGPAGGWRTVRVPTGGGGSAPAAAPGAPIDPDQRREIAAAKARAEQDLAAAQAALADKSSRFTALHPDVRALQARVERERARVQAATAALATLHSPAAPIASAGAAASGESRTVVRRVRVHTASDKPESKQDDKAHKQALVELETEWASLTRTAAEARAKNQQVEASLFKAELASKSETDGSGANMVILDPAYRPSRPMPPGRMTVGAIFLALSLFLGVGIVAGRAAIDDRIYGARDVERLGALLAEVPPLGLEARKARS